MKLEDLGPRICIWGPSNSGKSTLADAIGRRLDLPPIHLDQLHHRPGTDWQPRPVEEFVALHDEAIAGERWVMDGNYSRCFPQRLTRATGVILLDTSTALSLFRYFRRCWFERRRLGGLEGGADTVKWLMIRHIVTTARVNRKRYDALFQRIDLPKIRLPALSAVAAFYKSQRLER